MKLQTARFGELEIADQEVYLFEEGIPGFVAEKEFVLVEVEGHDPFSYIQSVTTPDLAFVIIDPFILDKRYEFDLADAAMNDIGFSGDQRIIIRVIVSIRDSLGEATANMVAPLVLNVESRKGKQIILTQGDYSTKHPLIKPNANE